MAEPAPAQALPSQTPSPATTRGGTRGRGRGHGRGSTAAPPPPADRFPNIRWDDKDPRIRARTTRLIAWCNTYPDRRVKLFSDSHQEASNEGRQRQQMSTQRETYYKEIAEAVFKEDGDEKVRRWYVQDPSRFIKPIKHCFHS